MPQQVDLNQPSYQAARVAPVDNSVYLEPLAQAAEAGFDIAEKRTFDLLQQDVAKLEQGYRSDKQATQQAFADVKSQLAAGNQPDNEVADLQAQAVKLAAKLRQGGNNLDYVTKLQLAAKQAKMRTPWAADKIEATFQRYVGSEGSSQIYTDYQVNQKMQQQYQSQLISAASEMGLHPADPYLEEKVMQARGEAYKLNARMRQLEAAGAEDEVLSRELINSSVNSIDNQTESVVSALVEQYGGLDRVPPELREKYVQQIRQLKANARSSVERLLSDNGLIKRDKEHLGSMMSNLNNKLDLLEDTLTGKLSADIATNNLSIAEDGTMLELYKKSPGLFKALMINNKAPNAQFTSQIEANRLGQEVANFIRGEYSQDPKVRSSVIGTIGSAMTAKTTEPEAIDQLGQSVITALEKGTVSPGSMTEADRDKLIDLYRNPQARKYFESDPQAIPVLARALEYKLHQAIPTAIKQRYDAKVLQQVQANTDKSGKVSFVLNPDTQGDVSEAYNAIEELNRAIAPAINKAVDTWATYSANQGKISFDPYRKLQGVMKVNGLSDITLPQAEVSQPVKQQPVGGVRRVVRRPDGTLGFED